MTPNPRDHRKLVYALLIAGCFALSFCALFYPIYVIRPFRHQGPRELAWALAILSFRPLAMLCSAAAALLAATLYWHRQPRTPRRIAAVLGAAGVCLFAGLSRVNIYEMMFHPLDRPAFAPAAETHLDGDERVIAVALAGSARAYPIRSISYHHIVNDVVGGVPIVATY